MTYKLIAKLKDPEYRKAFVASQINIGLPFQLRALLKARGKTQEWLAEKAGMLQPRISALLTPGKTKPNIETLRRLAEAFDCGLAVRFVPFSELAGWSEAFDPESFAVPDFDDDTGFTEPEEKPKAATALSQYEGALPDYGAIYSSRRVWGPEQCGHPESGKDLQNIPPLSSQAIVDVMNKALEMARSKPTSTPTQKPGNGTKIYSIRDAQNPSSKISEQILKSPSVAA